LYRFPDHDYGRDRSDADVSSGKPDPGIEPGDLTPTRRLLIRVIIRIETLCNMYRMKAQKTHFHIKLVLL
jgi:hypothetical protein